MLPATLLLTVFDCNQPVTGVSCALTVVAQQSIAKIVAAEATIFAAIFRRGTIVAKSRKNRRTDRPSI
jgi:hypothetical protein